MLKNITGCFTAHFIPTISGMSGKDFAIYPYYLIFAYTFAGSLLQNQTICIRLCYANAALRRVSL